jgi:hypothetical protein
MRATLMRGKWYAAGNMHIAQARHTMPKTKIKLNQLQLLLSYIKRCHRGTAENYGNGHYKQYRGKVVLR